MNPRLLALLQRRAEHALDGERRQLRTRLDTERRALADGQRARLVWQASARQPAPTAANAVRNANHRTAAAAAIVVADRMHAVASRETATQMARTTSAHHRVRILERLVELERERALAAALRRERDELEAFSANRRDPHSTFSA